jgi:hypothetical protein
MVHMADGAHVYVWLVSFKNSCHSSFCSLFRAQGQSPATEKNHANLRINYYKAGKI